MRDSHEFRPGNTLTAAQHGLPGLADVGVAADKKGPRVGERGSMEGSAEDETRQASHVPHRNAGFACCVVIVGVVVVVVGGCG